MKFQYLVFVSIFLLSASCGDDNLQITGNINCSKYYKSLPDYSSSGRHIFGCKVNGEDWVAYTDPFAGTFGGPNRLETSYLRNEVGDYLNILAKRIIEEENCDSTSQSFFLKGYAELNNSKKLSRYTELVDYDKGCSYKIDTSIINEVVITHFDTIERIISGTFHATLISQDCNDTLVITDGRFDDTY